MQAQRRLEVQKCPMCGAPLRIQPNDTTALCIYCDAPITIHLGSHGEYQLSEDHVLGREAAAQIKKLLSSGQHAQACALYTQKTGASPGTANQVIENYSEHSHASLFFSSTLNAIGMCVILVALGLVGIGAWLFTISVGWGVVVTVPGVLWLLLFRDQFFRTIRYLLSARIGQAKVLYHALLGEEIEGICIVRLDLEVHGPGGDHFEVETHFKVKESALSKIQSGQLLQVKYLKDRPESVLYGRGLDSTVIS